MDRSDTAVRLRWLMILRVVTITSLLVSAFAIELLLRPGETLRPLFLLSAAAYGLVLLYAVLDRWLHGTRIFLLLQLAGDALVLTGFVGITGGLSSPMTFLYLLPISVGALLLYREGALSLAAFCWALYALLAAFGSSWLPSIGLGPMPTEGDPARVGYRLVVHGLAFLAVALLSASLSERLRVQGHELHERRGAVARLQALNENIVESINSGLITTDQDGVVTFMNRGGGEILGLTQADVHGRPVESLLGLSPGALQEIRQQLKAHRRYRFEAWLGREGEKPIFLGIAASHLTDRAGRPLGTILIFQDLTEIHALEQEVRLKERMAALGEMAAGMAHELRNPLAAMSGAVQYLKGSLPPDGETLELMDIILRESQRLDQAIRDFLTFARPGTFAPVRCDLVRLLEENLRLLSKSRELRAGHRIKTSFPRPELWCEVDPNRMKQVFWNLASNALKAMPEGGSLTVTAGPTADRAVEISFEDEGTGMDELERDSYFHPFRGSFREGTGLGAAIVYRLIEEHGGRIALDTAPGRGTRVRIILPAEAEAARPGELSRAAAGGSRR